MEPVENAKRCGCRWCMNGCRIQPITEELDKVILSSLTVAKIQTDFVDAVVVNDKEGIVFGRLR